MMQIVVVRGVDWNRLENHRDELFLGDGLLDEDVVDALPGELLIGEGENHLALNKAVELMVGPVMELTLGAAVAHSTTASASRKSCARLLYSITFVNFAGFAVLVSGQWLGARIGVDAE